MPFKFGERLVEGLSDEMLVKVTEGGIYVSDDV